MESTKKLNKIKLNGHTRSRVFKYFQIIKLFGFIGYYTAALNKLFLKSFFIFLETDSMSLNQ